MTGFGALLREHRAARGLSLRGLGERINFHRGYVGRVEQGERFPTLQFARLADDALDLGGVLVAAWEQDQAEREHAESTGRLLLASAADSLRVVRAIESDADDDDLHSCADRLAVDYLAQPPGPILLRGVELQSALLTRLRRHDYRPQGLDALMSALSRVQGVLAYTALDLDDPATAATHARAAWALADRRHDDQMRMWVRGTQSLIARFQKNYAEAERLVLDGLRYDAAGTGRIRLLAGLAQSRANQADARGARDALAVARRSRDDLRSDDNAPGLFTFSEAKQRYYTGSSLMWLDDAANLRAAAAAADDAVTMWQNSDDDHRPLGDEALARVYRATALIRLGDLDQAAEAVRPVLDLPEDRRISWITTRLGNLHQLLTAPPYDTARHADDLRDRIANARA